ncbi:KxYKxGKxW signal peptide domain-containing protein [Lactiplantibacillus pentosus]|uniref:KxYKxGKxW signal peptide domain-containing protein n=1 Tax=Lactiplantibacillus pentosus TaxID=1589 RepID=UPI001CFFB909|nr:KxYKxGKxW signal peptide domain-containing protein [Lactiplantibacillus pentosus]MCB5222558.1 KxYKxGKxW signal peptide domain-containing protein [Lactiplantibacillus pentosus]
MKRNSQPSATIDHYKMFKDGKHWVYAGITIAGLGSTLMLTTNALADTTTPVSATTTAFPHPIPPLVTNSVRLPGQLRLIRVR